MSALPKPITADEFFGKVLSKKSETIFFASKWNEVYDFIEFVLKADPCGNYAKLAENLNYVFKDELSAYRIIDKRVTDITSEEEISLLADALNDDQFSGVTAHLRQAFQLYTDRKVPDYRNSIKESISAVEAMAKIMTGLSNATLGDALKRLEKDGLLKPSLKIGFEKLYAYTNDKNGIRHAMLEETTISASEAQFFLLSCTSFVNYLKSLMR